MVAIDRSALLNSLLIWTCLWLENFVSGIPTTAPALATATTKTISMGFTGGSTAEITASSLADVTTVKIEEKSTTLFPMEVQNIEKVTSATSAAPRKAQSVKPAKSTLAPRQLDEIPLYRMNGENGQACILLAVDAEIVVKYKTKMGDMDETAIYVPREAKIAGDCESEKYVTMSLKWDSFALVWSFAKTPGGERWYVDKIELMYNTNDRRFAHIDKPNKTIRLSSALKHTSMLFPTPVGKSYVCSEEISVDLTDGRNHATVMLRELKLQPFKFKNNQFAAEFSCTSLSARANRDETAAFAVGSTLAAAVLLTISGYAGYRHFRIKKTNYGTME